MDKDWQSRLTEANIFVREHEEQMRFLRESPLFKTGVLGLDSETVRAFASMREQQSFIERMALPIESLRFSETVKKLASPLPSGLSAKAMESITGFGALAAKMDGIIGAGSAYAQASKSLADFNDRFRVPQLGEISRLMPKLPDSIWRQYEFSKSTFEKIASEFRSPWLDVQRQLESLTGLAKLQGIGHLIAARPTFDLDAVSALRIDFGDWRDRISFPEAAATDVPVRAAFYAERGYNPALADFPSDVFEEGIGGLRGGVPALISAYGEPVPPSSDEAEEEGFYRNNVVHDWLQRFETQIRRFIDMLMTQQYGSDWPRHQLPPGIYDRWVAKRSKDKSGRGWPLVYYADFTDYERVICRQDNWKTIFAQYFNREEHVRESLQRLHLPRLATMHARPLTQDDELFVFVEIKRLVKLFGL